MNGEWEWAIRVWRNPAAVEAGSMRLLWSSRSPFVRKVLIAAHELGIADRIELVSCFVTGKIPVPDVEQFNPSGQIPHLITGRWHGGVRFHER